MAYTVLARRYRSTAFGGVVGQQTIARTLQNAIAAGRVAHAYLFTGTRGVGKTSMARIFARALNAPATIADCPPPPDADPFPPDDVQGRMADAIMRGEDLNVIEIDGASNNSVDQARQLIANASLLPTGNARHKVYIIDEVHMLSREAFNALLKTMEEPPEHVKFILCTTESHKVPATIQSRCQRFDFRNIPTGAIAEHLRSVLGDEKIEADDEVVWQVARLGRGSMRDALSLLDRLIAVGEQPLSVKLIEQMLGLPPQDLVVTLIDELAAANVSGALQQTAALLDSGIALDQLCDVLIERLRQLMLIAACGADSELVELSDDARKEATEQAGRFDAPGLVHMIALCENLQRAGKSSSHPRALLDATIVRLALAEKMADVTAILAGGGSAGLAEKKNERPRAVGRQVTAAKAAVASAGNGSLRPAQSDTVNEPAAPPPISSTSPSPAARVIATDNPRLVWDAVLADAADKSSLSWLQKLNLQQLGDGRAVVAVHGAGRDMHRFASQHRARLAELIKQATGKPVRVEIADVAAGVNVEADAPATSAPDADSQATRPPVQRVDQQTAMSLPLVRHLLEHFDVTLIEAHQKKEGAGQ